MKRFCFSHKRKVQQRRMNRIVRQWNRIVENDELWRGRFVIRQKEGYMVRFFDGSGSQFWVKLRFIDRKTGYCEDIMNDANHWSWHLGWELNDFIVNPNRANAWRAEEDPRKDNTDYRNVDYSHLI